MSSPIGASWFDAFRDNGGPVLYSSMNRTPAIEDIRNILIYITFSTFFVAFLIIFPGIRKEVSDILTNQNMTMHACAHITLTYQGFAHTSAHPCL